MQYMSGRDEPDLELQEEMKRIQSHGRVSYMSGVKVSLQDGRWIQPG